MNEFLETTTFHKVTVEFIGRVIDSYNNGKYEPTGMYYAYDDKAKKYIGCDNRTGDAWTEDFDTEKECLIWLVYGNE